MKINQGKLYDHYGEYARDQSNYCLNPSVGCNTLKNDDFMICKRYEVTTLMPQGLISNDQHLIINEYLHKFITSGIYRVSTERVFFTMFTVKSTFIYIQCTNRFRHTHRDHTKCTN